MTFEPIQNDVEPFDLRPDVPASLAGRIPSALRSGRRLGAILEAYGLEMQELEDALFTASVDNTVDAATGARLDRFAAIVGEQRLGLGDADLRRFIKARIGVNRSSGTRQEVSDIVRILTAPSTVVLRDAYPAAVFGYAVVDNLYPPVIAARIGRTAAPSVAAGVAITLAATTPVSLRVVGLGPTGVPGGSPAFGPPLGQALG